MFKTLIEIFRKADLLQQAYEASVEMLKIDKEMFDAAYMSLRNSDKGEMAVDVYAQDKKINEYQRDVRRKVLAHMVATPSRDMVFGLILTSIVIDIERIGDYTKNIVELARMHPKRLSGKTVEKEIADIESNVSERFDILINAFENSDVEAARTVMMQHRETSQRCDGILSSILQEEYPKISTIDSVSIVLYTRYLKRVSSHITNIASGVVNPFDRIGFTE